MTTGETIKAYRERFGLNQEIVASFLKIKREMLSYYETDTREAPLDVLEKLSDLFGIELADFFDDEGGIQTNLAFAFRAEGLMEKDLEEIAAFKKVVKNYVKLISLENK